MDSVFCQTSDDYEYIIIDGASTDGGAELIQEYLSKVENAEKVSYWCSEKDSGIWDAMNKGVSHASSRYILMLNSGDVLRSDSVVADLSAMNLTADIIYGDTSCVTSTKNWIVDYPDPLPKTWFRNGATLGHQSALLSTELSKKTPYHLDYKLASDAVFFIECIDVQKCSIQHINYLISDFDAETGCSSIKENDELRFNEWVKIWQTYYPGKIHNDFDLLNDYQSCYGGFIRRLRKLLNLLSGKKNWRNSDVR